MPSQTQLAIAVVAGGATVAAILYYLRSRSEATPAGHATEGVIKEVYRTSLQRQALMRLLRVLILACTLTRVSVVVLVVVSLSMNESTMSLLKRLLA